MPKSYADQYAKKKKKDEEQNALSNAVKTVTNTVKKTTQQTEPKRASQEYLSKRNAARNTSAAVSNSVQKSTQKLNKTVRKNQQYRQLQNQAKTDVNTAIALDRDRQRKENRQKTRAANERAMVDTSKAARKISENATAKTVIGSLEQTAGGHLKTIGDNANKHSYSMYRDWVNNEVATGRMSEEEGKKYLQNLESSPAAKNYEKWQGSKTKKALDKVYETGSKLNEAGNKNIEEASKDAKGLKKAYLGAVNSGVGMLTDLAAGPAWALSMYSRTYGNTRGQVEDLGGTTAQDMTNASLQALKEAATEHLFMGVGLARGLANRGLVQGMNIADRVGAKILSKAEGRAANFLSGLGRVGAGVLEENVEELAGWALDPLITEYAYGKDLRKKEARDVLKAQSAELLSQFPDENSARAAALYVGSDEFIQQNKQSYMESGLPEEESQRLAETMQEYMIAALSNDTETMLKTEQEMIKFMSGAGGISKDSWSLKELGETFASTTLLTATTGLPSAITTSQIGSNYQSQQGKDAVQALAKTVINLDPEMSAKAQAMQDRMDSGKDLTGTQVYDLLVSAQRAIDETNERADTAMQVAKKGVRDENLVDPVTVSDNGSIELGEVTDKKYDADVDSTLKLIDEYNKSVANEEERLQLQEEDKELVADAVAAFNAGVMTPDHVYVLSKANQAARNVFSEATGINLDQYDVYDKKGNLDIVQSNINMQDALFAQSAQNYIESARTETAEWQDRERGAAVASVNTRMEGNGTIALNNALKDVNPMDRGRYLMTLRTADAIYHAARNTGEAWDDVKAYAQRMAPDMDAATLQEVYEAGLRDREASEDAVRGMQVQIDEAISAKNAPNKPAPQLKIDTEVEPHGSMIDLFSNLVQVTQTSITLSDKLGPKVNGTYLDKTDEIVLNVSNEGYLDRNIGYTFMHEFTHHMQLYAPQEYQALKNAVRRRWEEKDPEGFKARIAAKIEQYKGYEDLTDDRALDEIIADGAHEFLNDEQFVEQICDENPSLAKQIINSIKNVLRKLRQLFGMVNDPMQKQAIFSQLDMFAEAEELWMRAFQAAVKNKAEAGLIEWDAAARGENTINDSAESFSLVEDPADIQRLEDDIAENGYVKTYRGMAEIDGKYYSPMSSMVKDEKGKYVLREGLEPGQWVSSDITTDSRMFNNKGQFILMKDNGKPVPAAYNPYMHSSNSMMNDQFSTQYKRPNLVVIEGLVPISELESGYRAEHYLDDGRYVKAKNTLGETIWKSGGIQGELDKLGRPRTVYLTKHFKMLREVPVEEVAQHIHDKLEGTGIPLTYNVVTPALRKELLKLGTNMVQSDEAKYRVELDNEDRELIEKNPNARYSLSEETIDEMNDLGAEVTEGGTVVKYSLASWQATDVEALRQKLIEAGYEEADVNQWIENVNGIAARIFSDKDRLDYTADEFQDALKENAEYYYTLDLSTLCQKRRLYQGTYNAIMHQLVNRGLQPEDTIKLRRMMDDMGYEVPCGICYEESRKKNEGKFAERWLNGYGKQKGYKNTEHKDPYIPTIDEVTTTDGRERLRKEHPEAYESYIQYQKTRGSANPKVSFTHTDYRGDILRMTASEIAKVKHIGGLRIQSFSDFEIVQTIDMMQAVMDMAAKNLTAQAYTKVPAFADIFGGTGIKINLSLIGKVNENGVLEFDSKEGIDPDEAFRIREKYSKNVGTIIVGANDASILAAWADPRIDMVIPFHRSGWGKKEFDALGLKDYKDFTKGQTERYLMNGKDMALSTASKALGLTGDQKLQGIYPSDYWDENLSGKENAEKYLKLCAEKHYRPVFYQFLHDNGDGSWSLQEDGSTDGYWKSLVDFKMYDNEGNAAPQEEVKPNFDMDVANKAMADYEGDADTLPVAQDVVDQFVEEYKQAHPNVRFSITPETDSDGNELSQGQVEFFKDSKVRDEQGRLMVMYHGTENAGFTVFDSSYGISSPRFFFVNNLERAKGYSGTHDIFNAKSYSSLDEVNELIKEIGYEDVAEQDGDEYIIKEDGEEILREKSLTDLAMAYNEYTGWGGDSANYRVYLNVTNPLIVDAAGSNWDEISWNGISITTNELAEVALAEGYDGLIVDNVLDYGLYASSAERVPQTDVIVFNADQIKDTRNQDPTNNPDIRYSIPPEDDVLAQMAEEAEDVEDVPATDPMIEEGRVRMAKSKEDFFNTVNAKWNPAWLTEGKVLKEGSVRKDIRQLVMAVMQNSNTQYKYRKDLVDRTVNDAKQAFRLMQESKHKEASELLWKSALNMIENVEFFEDDMDFEVYKDIRNFLRNYPISIDERFYRDVDYAAFRKKNFGKLRLVRDGVSVDQVYQELEEQWPGIFDSELYYTPADQLLHIGEVVESSLDPYRKAYTSEEAAREAWNIASDLYDIIYEGEEYESVADKYKKKYDRLSRNLKTRHAEAMMRVRQNNKAAMAKEKKKTENQKQRAEAWKTKYREEKQKEKERRINQKNVKEHARHFGSIQKNYDWLVERLLSPTKDKNIPEQFRISLAHMLQAFDLQTERSKALEEKYGVAKKTLAMRELRDRLAEISKEDESGPFVYNGYLFDLMNAMSEKIEGETIDALHMSDLADVDTLLAAIVHNFQNYNKVRLQNKQMEIADIAGKQIQAMRDRIEKYGMRKTFGGVRGLFDNLLNEGEETPVYFFERIDPTGEGIGAMYKELRRGEDKHIRNMQFLRERFEEIGGKYYKKGKPGSEMESWRDNSQAQTFNLANGPITLTPAQIMSLYCLSKREQALGHILGNGIVASPVTFGQKLAEKVKGTVNPVSSVLITYDEVQTIIATLTEDQIKIANEMQKLMANEMAEWGNETSMELYGIKMFKDQDYFPIRSSREVLAKQADSFDTQEKIKNFGFAKPIVRGANNAIAIDDIFSVVADHCNKMSLYNSMAVPISDFMRVYNYKQTNEDNSQTAVQAIIGDAFTRKANDYIMKFIGDVNGNTKTRSDAVDAMMNKFLANYKKASIGANARVALQQPTAIFRAFMVLDPKWLVGVVPNRKATQEMFEHCPIALWKSWGHYDMDMGRDMEDIMMNKDWSKWDTVTMGVYGALDNMTWGMIWQAVKKEVRANNPGIKEGSDEFWRLCNERASEVFDKTQVVDSIFHRSDTMRSKGTLTKMAVSFMAEPTLTYNAMRDSLVKANELWKDGDKLGALKQFNKMAAVLALNAAAVSAAAALWDAVRGKGGDEDDEEKFWELWYANFAENFLDNANPINNIYFVKDIISLKDGWGTSNMALEGFETFFTGWSQLKKKLAGDSKKSWYDIFMNLLGGTGYITGLPVKTIMRDAKALYKKLGLEVFAADTLEEAKEENKTPIAFIRDGSKLDNLLNKWGYNLTEKEVQLKKARDKQATKDVKTGVTPQEYQEIIEQVAAEGHSGDDFNRRVAQLISEKSTGIEINVKEEKTESKSSNSKSSGGISTSEYKKIVKEAEDIGLSGDELHDYVRNRISEREKEIGLAEPSKPVANQKAASMENLKSLEDKALAKAAGKSGKDRADILWDIVGDNYTHYVTITDWEYLNEMRTFLEANGGDVKAFDQKCLDAAKIAYKKTLVEPELVPIERQQALYEYMTEHGMTQQYISSEILYKSYVAKDLKAAFRMGNQKYIERESAVLFAAGLLKDDYDKLYRYRNSGAKYYTGKYSDEKYATSTGKYTWPVNGEITSGYGYRGSIAGTNPFHAAIDIGGNMGDPIAAADGGTVLAVNTGYNGGYGNQVVIRHDDGTETWYSHMSGFNVRVGDTVGKGDQIGQVGSTGASTGPHLDFRVKVNGEFVNPLEYLSA